MWSSVVVNLDNAWLYLYRVGVWYRFFSKNFFNIRLLRKKSANSISSAGVRITPLSILFINRLICFKPSNGIYWPLSIIIRASLVSCCLTLILAKLLSIGIFLSFSLLKSPTALAITPLFTRSNCNFLNNAWSNISFSSHKRDTYPIKPN